MNTHHSHEHHEAVREDSKSKYMLPGAIVIAGVIVASGIFLKSSSDDRYRTLKASQVRENEPTQDTTLVDEELTPLSGVRLPVVWGDLGVQLVKTGAIDGERLRALYEERGQFSKDDEKLLFGKSTDRLVITPKNAGLILNLLWALGLAQDNPILTQGEMVDKRYGGAQNFASTGGWTMAKGNAMDHYSKHVFFNLTPEQQALVDKVSRTVYRPCCGNSTHFPDCNHGMAMLALLELMASQGATEAEMYKAGVAVNSFWFPDQYEILATFIRQSGGDWKTANPQTILGASMSSAQGFSKIASQVRGPIQSSGGGSGCGVDTGGATSQRRSSGCGI
ncbi:MAG TPA: hypothetical protein VFQ72_01005 [Candidatus Paceibacterota bacterium]|nr:hypothetical protein [Candidatus Paceibacterota bacterium]